MNIWLISTLVTLLLSSYFYHQADEILEEIEDFIDGDQDDDDSTQIQNDAQQGKIQMPVISNCMSGKFQNNVSGTTFCEYSVEQSKVQVKPAKPIGLKGKYAKNTNQIKTTPKTQQTPQKNHVPQNPNTTKNINQQIPTKSTPQSHEPQAVNTRSRKKGQQKKSDKHQKKQEKAAPLKHPGDKIKPEQKKQAGKPLKTATSSSKNHKHQEKASEDYSEVESSQKRHTHHGRTYDNRQKHSHHHQNQKKQYQNKYSKNEKYVAKSEKEKNQKNYYKKRH